MLTDQEILDLFHTDGRREQAFGLLLKKYDQKLYWHIRRIVIDHDDADDVLQNTFLKIWKNLEKFRADAQLFSWMYRIATNECINFINQKKKHQHLTFDSTDSEEDNTFQASRVVKGESFQVDSEHILDRLKAAIESLPEKQRIVFSMRYYDEFSYEEMSEMLGTSVGALKASYHHAVQKVEKFVSQTD